MNQDLQDTSNPISDKSSEAFEFCQLIFGNRSVSFRCVAEGAALKEQLSKLNGEGEKLHVLKLTPEQGPIEARLKQAGEFNKKGYAVFYLPTEFSGRSETYKDAVYFRAFVVDLDGAPVEPVLSWEIPPTVVVETSPGKYHCIWKFSEPVKVRHQAGGAGASAGREGVTCDEFNEVLSGLSSLFNGDLSTAKATQCFRLPGFLHQKGAIYESRIFQGHSAVKTGGIHADASYSALSAAVARHTKLSRGSLKGHKQGRTDLLGQLEEDKQAVSEVKVPLSRARGAKGLGKESSGPVPLITQGARHEHLVAWGRALVNEGKNFDECLAELRELAFVLFTDKEDFQAGGRRDSEVQAAVRDNFKYEEKERQEYKDNLDEVIGEDKEHAVSEFNYDFSVGTLKVDRYTESGIADRVLQRFSKDLARIDNRVYCYHAGKALWVAQKEGEYGETKARTLRCIQDAVNEREFKRRFCVDKKGNLDEAKEHAAKAALYKVHVVNNISKSVLNHIGISSYRYADFDSNPDLFYCSNGVLNLESGEIREARNEDRLINRSNVIWDSEAQCPGWLKFLSEVFAQNEEPLEMIRFMQEVFAYSLSGYINEQKLFCYQGGGNNGKSLTIDALKGICGAYSTIIEPEDLTIGVGKFQKAFERIGAKVEGHRVIILDDFQMAGSWNEAFVKVLTGPEIRARGEYEKSRVCCNRTKFHIGMNKPPTPEEENYGILRRLCFIPFPRKFAENHIKEKELREMLRVEASGILGWAVKGFKRVKEAGIKYPKETLTALESYKRETFKVETAIEELFEVPTQEAEELWEVLDTLVKEVNQHLEETGSISTRVNNDSLGRALKNSGFKQCKRYNSMCMNTVSHFLVKRKNNRTENHAVQLLK